MPLMQVCSCFDRYWGFPTPFPLLLSFDRENSSGGETAASPKGSISIHPLDICGRDVCTSSMHLQFLGKLPLTERFAFHAYVGVCKRDWIITIRRPAYFAAYFATYAEQPAERPTFGHRKCEQTQRSLHSRPTPKRGQRSRV